MNLDFFAVFLVILAGWFTSVAYGQTTKTKLKVVSKLLQPYLVISSNSSDQKDFRGFVVDILDELARLKNFEYEFKITDKNGFVDPDTNKWVGMIGDLVDGKADLAFSDITVTSQRLEVVEFTYPFLSFNLGALHYKTALNRHHHQASEIFSPFSTHVWSYVIIMCCVYFLVLFLIGRISYKDWRVDNFKKGYKNELGLFNSFWFMASSLFFRTTHTTPRGVATRFLSICFYFFTLLIGMLYISNLTAHIIAPHSSTSKPLLVEDLLQDNNLQFAAIKSGSTHEFLKNSKFFEHKDIFAAIPDSNFFGSYGEAEEAMKQNPNLVLVVESPQMGYITNRQCSYKGANIARTQRSYAIAVQPRSPYNQLISQGLVEMKHYGKLDLYYHKWWVEKGGGQCSINQQVLSEKFFAHELSISNIHGICMFFGIAVVASIVIAILEYCVRSLCIAKERKESSFGNIKANLRLMCTCRDRHLRSILLEENEAINIDPV